MITDVFLDQKKFYHRKIVNKSFVTIWSGIVVVRLSAYPPLRNECREIG